MVIDTHCHIQDWNDALNRDWFETYGPTSSGKLYQMVKEAKTPEEGEEMLKKRYHHPPEDYFADADGLVDMSIMLSLNDSQISFQCSKFL